MTQTKRQHDRIPVDYEVVFLWEDETGQVHNTRPRARDASDGGLRVASSVPIESGTQICVDLPRFGSAIEAIVCYCIEEERGYRIGVQFSAPDADESFAFRSDLDYYEILQLSPKADQETIHRVYRIMAARFHPDNPDSGDKERFLLLSEAYKVVSDPLRRSEYDQVRGTDQHRPLPLFQARAFVDEKEGEINRRLGVLCLLYAQRRRNPDHPTITLMELEEMMSIPRDYLEFTLWYLKQKQYVEMTQGADYCLTAAGVDFVEEHTPAQDILRKLLTGGGSRATQTRPPQDFQFVTSHVN